MEQEKIWEYFQNDGVDSFDGNKRRLRILASRIKKKETKILNIGIGNGFLEKILFDHGKSVYCLDPSETAITNICSSLGLSPDHAKVGYSQKIPFAANFFDVVIMSELIEHLDDDTLRKSLTEAARVLKPGGRLIGTTPANEKLDVNKCVCPACNEIFHRWGHTQSFDDVEIRKIFNKDFNHTIIERKFFGDWQAVNWKGKIGYGIKEITLACGFKGSNENYLFTANKSIN